MTDWLSPPLKPFFFHSNNRHSVLLLDSSWHGSNFPEKKWAGSPSADTSSRCHGLHSSETFRDSGTDRKCSERGRPIAFLMVRAIRLSFETIDSRLEDAARSLGGHRWHVFCVISRFSLLPKQLVNLVPPSPLFPISQVKMSAVYSFARHIGLSFLSLATEWLAKRVKTVVEGT